jgi:hypothetical protein
VPVASRGVLFCHPIRDRKIHLAFKDIDAPQRAAIADGKAASRLPPMNGGGWVENGSRP